MRPERLVAVLCAILDGSVWLAAYGATDSEAGAYFSLYYAVSVSCKAVLLLCFSRTVNVQNAKILWPFYVPIGISVLASIVMGTTNAEGVVQPVGVIVSLAMTITFLNGDNVTSYMKAFGISSVAACGLFFFQLHFVPLNTALGVSEVVGRYSFVFGSHPNLGGEILFTGFVSFCVARSNTTLIVAIFVVYFSALNLMESRAAMLSITTAFCIHLYSEKLRLLAVGARFVVLIAAMLVLGALCIVFWDKVADVLLLNNQYRGLGTGYVGRDDHWEAAWETFLQSPFVGVGFGYFRQDVVTPHSMWMGMLSMMGMMSVFIVIVIFKNSARVYATNYRIFLLLLSFIPMTVFNDRFLNLNPYPFLLYVLLFLPRGALLAEGGIRDIGRKLRSGMAGNAFRGWGAGVRTFR